MSLWIIEPHEPLIFRDGRPFGSHPGVRAHSLPFPIPSTTTGAVRTQVGLDEQGIFTWTTDEQLSQLKELPVRGPLLVQLAEPTDEYKSLHWFAPAPADALLLKPGEKLQGHKAKAELRRLVPLQIGDDAQTDLAGLTEESDPPLSLVGSARPLKSKPSESPPTYWHWSAFQQWLLNPTERRLDNWNDLGIRGPQNEVRVHSSMDRDRHTSKDGALFETRGLEFVSSNQENLGFDAHSLALAVSVGHSKRDDRSQGIEPRSGFSTLGGERRMVYWQRSDSDLPECPAALVAQIEQERACRVILLTPAYFKRGCYPGELLAERDGVKPVLKAMAVQRPQVVSGWEFVRKSVDGKSRGKPGPKETRRLTPAGSVFFLKLPDNISDTAISSWLDTIWMSCISDERQYRLDGFGLAVVGTWDGKLREMGKEQEA